MELLQRDGEVGQPDRQTAVQTLDLDASRFHQRGEIMRPVFVVQRPGGLGRHLQW
ncbi:MAG: hypothetical protein HWD60_02845 [Defluviicoccus sp.]|nr:MAG: hypothetical protein HWD60_02845 [Defluviicoccus sp.]